MPPQLLFDLSQLDLEKLLFDQQAIREMNPHRGDMEQLNGVVWANPDEGRILGYKDVRADEFWVAGHIPGRPLQNLGTSPPHLLQVARGREGQHRFRGRYHWIGVLNRASGSLFTTKTHHGRRR
jgi:hypothetical protein